jgi:hypothetical protein
VKRIVAAFIAMALLCSCDARERWLIADRAFYPVSIDYWAEDQSFLIGSYEHGTVLRIATDGVADTAPYLPASFPTDGRRKALRLAIDSPRDRLWVLDTDRVYVYSLRERSVLAKIDLPRGARVARGGCLPDMTLNPFSGTVYVADAREPKLHVISEESGTEALVRTELPVLAPQGQFAGALTALAVIPASHAVLAASAETGALWRVDPITGQAQAVALSGAANLEGVCSMRSLVYPARTYTYSQDTQHELYFSSLSTNMLGGLRLSAGLDRADLVNLTRLVALDEPVGFAVINGFVLAASSQLARHPDLGGDGRPIAPFRLVPIPGALATPANEGRVGARGVRVQSPASLGSGPGLIR